LRGARREFSWPEPGIRSVSERHRPFVFICVFANQAVIWMVKFLITSFHPPCERRRPD
jgi:hypothetical protein